MIGYIYTSIVGLAFFTSLVSFRFHYEWHLKFFSILLGITFLIELLTIVMSGMNRTTQWVYNIFVPFEFICYSYYYLRILKTKSVRRAIRVAAIVYPTAGLASTFIIFKFYNWNSYQAIGEALLTIVLAISYYYELSVSEEEFDLKKKPEFWIATGMIIFYSCQLPFLGSVNYLVKVSQDLALKLLDVLDYIDILMYLIFCYAFLCRIIIRKWQL